MADTTTLAMRDYLAERYKMPDRALDAMAADLAAIAQAQQQPLTLNGHQLLDAINSIAPQRSAPQLATTVCIHHEPACTVGTHVPPRMYMWLADCPKAGAIELFDNGEQPPPASQDVVYIATKLIEAARWVFKTPSARKQPDARALARAILHLACPLINAHVSTQSAPTKPN